MAVETDMVDSFREHRIYVNSENMRNITNIQYITNIHYIQTLLGGHRILSFTKKHPKGKEYYKMNINFQKDTNRKMVEETINEVERQQNRDTEMGIILHCYLTLLRQKEFPKYFILFPI